MTNFLLHMLQHQGFSTWSYACDRGHKSLHMWKTRLLLWMEAIVRHLVDPILRELQHLGDLKWCKNSSIHRITEEPPF